MIFRQSLQDARHHMFYEDERGEIIDSVSACGLVKAWKAERSSQIAETSY